MVNPAFKLDFYIFSYDVKKFHRQVFIVSYLVKIVNDFIDFSTQYEKKNENDKNIFF